MRLSSEQTIPNAFLTVGFMGMEDMDKVVQE